MIKRVKKRAVVPKFNIKYTVFPHTFLHGAKVFHKSYSFAQSDFSGFSTLGKVREKVYYLFFRAPQLFRSEIYRILKDKSREKQDG